MTVYVLEVWGGEDLIEGWWIKGVFTSEAAARAAAGDAAEDDVNIRSFVLG